MMTPSISVIVRTYNRPERLRECLQSLHRQSFQNFETVVVNDAGVEVGDTVQDELEPLPRQYIRNSHNLGRTAALNIGIAAARGNYLCFLDDDDAVYPDHLQTLISAAEPQQLPVVYSDVINVVYQQDPATQEWRRMQEQLVYSFDFDRDNFLLANYIPITCLLIRRDCFDAVGPFDESLLVYEDWEFLIRLSRRYDFLHLRKVTGEYRRRGDNSNILEAERYRDNERVVRRRYEEERNRIFDEKFKLNFQLQRELRQQQQRFNQLLQQAQQLQAQGLEVQKMNVRLQQELQRTPREKKA